MNQPMQMKTAEKVGNIEDAAAVLRALANPSRLMILCVLIDGERAVSEVETALELGQAYVSQQLARLREEGIVSATRDGRRMRYRLSDPRVAAIIAVLCKEFGQQG